MNERKLEYLAGIFVLVGIILAAYLAIRISGNALFQPRGDTIYAEFSNVGGLKVGSKVRLAGVDVGTIDSVRLDPETFYARVGISLRPGIRLDDDTIASIRTIGLVGEKFVALLPGGSGIYLADGDTIFDTESAMDIEGLISKFAFGSVD